MTGVLVLVFAWMLAVTIDHLQTAAFLSNLIQHLLLLNGCPQ